MNYLRKKGSSIMTGFLCCMTALAMFCCQGMEAQAYIQTQGTVIADSAKIRKEPSGDSSVIASILKGDSVTINNEETDSAGVIWYKVFVDSETLGYVRSDLIQKSGSSETTAAGAGNTGSDNSENLLEPATTNTDNQSQPSGTGGDTSGAADAAVGVQTTVTPVQSQGATITGDTVRVRAEATTSSAIVTIIPKSSAITVTGTADGDDGKVWYLVSFIHEGSEVTGFIRSDFVQLSEELVVIDQEVPEETPEDEQEGQTPEGGETEPVVNDAYQLVYESDPETGISEWYLYDNEEGVKNKLQEILDAAELNGESVEEAGKQLKTQKMVIIILAIFLVVLALTVTLLLFKIRDMYYEDFEDYDEDPEPVKSRNTPPRTVKPVQNNRPVARPAGGAAPQGRPAGTARPAGGAAPQGRPAGTGRPAGGAAPQGRPAGTGRPAGAGTAPGTQSRQQPETEGSRSEAKWKSRNFIAEDDDFEFEFLNWDGDDK